MMAIEHNIRVADSRLACCEGVYGILNRLIYNESTNG
jgi:hypothetical protein